MVLPAPKQTYRSTFKIADLQMPINAPAHATLTMRLLYTKNTHKPIVLTTKETISISIFIALNLMKCKMCIEWHFYWAIVVTNTQHTSCISLSCSVKIIAHFVYEFDRIPLSTTTRQINRVLCTHVSAVHGQQILVIWLNIFICMF